MAIVGSITGSFDPADSTVTLERPDLFSGATPKAAIVTVVQELQGTNSYNQNLTGIGYSLGAITSADQWACGISSEDNVGSQNALRRAMNSGVVIIPFGYQTPSAYMTGSLVADGITLTKAGSWRAVSGSAELFIEVTLLGGDDFSAWIPSGSYVDSGTRVGNIPFRPNLAMFGSISHDDENTNETSLSLSHGWVFDNGVDAGQARARIIKADDNASAGDSEVFMSASRFTGDIDNTSTIRNLADHTNFDTDGGNFEHNYTVDVYSASSFKFLPLYMRFANEDCGLSQARLPAGTGTYTKTGMGHRPSVVKVYGNSAASAYTTVFNGDASGNNFDWTIEGSGLTVSQWNEDAADPIDCNTRFDFGVCNSFDDTATNGYKAYAAHRTDDGFTMEVTQVGGVRSYAFVVSMGTPAETGLNMYLGSDPVSRIYLGSTEVSSAFLGTDNVGSTAWESVYSDPSPAQNEGDWDEGTTANLTQDAGGILWTATGTGIIGPSLDFTTVAGKDYRLTLATGAGGIASTLAVTDVAGSEVLTASPTLSAGVDSATLTFRALSTSSRISLVTVPSVSDTIRIDNIRIEELR